MARYQLAKEVSVIVTVDAESEDEALEKSDPIYERSWNVIDLIVLPDYPQAVISFPYDDISIDIVPDTD